MMNVQVDVSDSGYNSLPCKPLVCPQCGKAFKNKAEEKYDVCVQCCETRRLTLYRKHSSTHSRPFKCQIKNCTNLKGFATSNDLERHQKDIHLIRPKHGPQAYYRCVLPTCSKREKIWTRKDNFKAHITRMHKNMGIDIDHLIGRSEMNPTAAGLEQLARAKNAQIHNKNKGKQRASNQSKQAMMQEYGDTSSEPDASQAAIPLWQTHVPEYLDDVPQEAAEMVTAYSTRRVANTNVPNVVLKYPDGIPVNTYGYIQPNSRHNSADGAWDEMSDTSFAYSHESSAFGGGTSDFG
ncbi:hypothetical protein D6C90_03516 [Aureobasidium pullulans]|uniref:C2H2-type domain-containing protein n=1 Tax=Aureobasidium pullulans TaxID=5580 RepID=A0A4S9VCE4_AURPU|nr:hypothetical protein D6C90_03516 [Aureobasidium pullulans]